MPAKKCVWLDDEDGISPEPIQPRKYDQNEPITSTDARFPDTPPQDDQLLPQQRILGDQIWLAAHDIEEDALNDVAGGWSGQARDDAPKVGDKMGEHKQSNRGQMGIFVVEPYLILSQL